MTIKKAKKRAEIKLKKLQGLLVEIRVGVNDFVITLHPWFTRFYMYYMYI